MPHRRHHKSPLAWYQYAVLALAGAGAITWACWQGSQALAVAEFRAYLAQGQALPPVIPRRAALLRDAGRHLVEKRFPPDFEAASFLLGTALERQPADSSVWLELARFHLLQGATEPGRVALEFAQQLEPSNRQIQGASVQLWALAGEGDRALQTALQLSRLDAAAGREAARGLLVLGMQPVEVLSQLYHEHMSGKEVASLLEALMPPPGEARRRFLAALPQDLVDHKETAALLLRPAAEESQVALATMLWRRKDPDAFTPFPEGFIGGLGNAGLEQPIPLRADTLGWRQIAGAPGWRADWKPGQLQISASNDRQLHWPCYAFMLPPSEKACRVELILGGKEGTFRHSLSADWKGGGARGREGSLSVVIPPSPTGALVKLVLVAKNEDPPAGRLILEGIRVDFQTPSGEEVAG